MAVSTTKKTAKVATEASKPIVTASKPIKLNPASPPAKPIASSAKPLTAAKSSPKVENSNHKDLDRPLMKKNILIEKAVERSGIKKKDAKPAIEAALAVLGEAIDSGHDLNLPPLGKIKLIKSKDLTAGAKAHTVRLRTMKKDDG